MQSDTRRRFIAGAMAALVMAGAARAADPDPAGGRDWLPLLLGFEEGASCEEMTRAIETRGLAEPLAVVWHPCWVEHELLVELPRAEGARSGRAGFQRQPLLVQPILAGRARGRDLVRLHGAPYSYQLVQAAARARAASAPDVVAGPDGWQSPGWTLRWETYTGGVRAVRAGERDLVSSADGSGLVPLSGNDRDSARPVPVERADWVEAGPLRWAAEARARSERGQWLRIEYLPGQHSLAGAVGGAGWEPGVYWWRLPLVDRGAARTDTTRAARVLTSTRPGRIAAAWSISEPAGLLAVMLESEGELAAEAAAQDDTSWIVRWRLGDGAVGETGDRPLLTWRLRWVATHSEGSADRLAERVIGALGCVPEVVMTEQHEGRLVAAGTGCTLRGPARWGGPPATTDAGRWLVPLAVAPAGADDVPVEIWLARAPAAAWWAPAPERGTPDVWSPIPVLNRTLRLEPAALRAGPRLMLRVQW